MSSCLSSVLAVLGGHNDAGDDDATSLHRRLLAGWAAARSEKEEARSLAEEVRGLERELAAAGAALEQAGARRREAEARAGAAEEGRRAAAEAHDAEAERLRRAVDAQEEKEAIIAELEARIQARNNAISRWRIF
ncbi:hypothetical protein ACP4OV_016391 [Aristida adscensionis]